MKTNEKKQQQQQQQTFPFKLYEMLEYARASGVGSSISWLADGTGFVIHNKDVMMNDLTPMFFNQTKFRSFVSVLILTAVAVEVTQCRLLLLSISTLLDLASLSHSSLRFRPYQYQSHLHFQTRQLNLWGFLRTNPRGNNWKHNDFLRERPDLLKRLYASVSRARAP